jgi:long-subunit fatty acid transport protein
MSKRHDPVGLATRCLLAATGIIVSFATSADDYPHRYVQAIMDACARNAAIEAVIAGAGTITLRSSACMPPVQRAALKEALTEQQPITTVERHVPPDAAKTLNETQYAQTDEDEGILPEGALFAPLLVAPGHRNLL